MPINIMKRPCASSNSTYVQSMWTWTSPKLLCLDYAGALPLSFSRRTRGRVKGT